MGEPPDTHESFAPCAGLVSSLSQRRLGLPDPTAKHALPDAFVIAALPAFIPSAAKRGQFATIAADAFAPTLSQTSRRRWRSSPSPRPRRAAARAPTVGRRSSSASLRARAIAASRVQNAFATGDHVLAIFRAPGCWGALGESNFSGPRFPEPIHRALRELAPAGVDIFICGHG